MYSSPLPTRGRGVPGSEMRCHGLQGGVRSYHAKPVLLHDVEAWQAQTTKPFVKNDQSSKDANWAGIAPCQFSRIVFAIEGGKRPIEVEDAPSFMGGLHHHHARALGAEFCWEQCCFSTSKRHSVRQSIGVVCLIIWCLFCPKLTNHILHVAHPEAACARVSTRAGQYLNSCLMPNVAQDNIARILCPGH